MMKASNTITVFDRRLVRQHRNRAAQGRAAQGRAAQGFAKHAALFEEGAAHILDRLLDVKRDFTTILDLGGHDGTLGKALRARYPRALVVTTDISENMLRIGEGGPCAVVDEEWLPFAAGSFDLVVSNASLHWANDLPGVLSQIRLCLKPGGLFLGCLLGGETLTELRQVLLDAELMAMSGISPRLSPTVDLLTASQLMQRAGFHLPVADQESITLLYPNLGTLMHELRGMGEGNAHIERLRTPTPSALFKLGEKLYQERFADDDGAIPARFDLIFMHGWATETP